jgi:hypothetical protein
MSAVNQSTDNAVASCQIMSAVNQSTDNAVASSQKHVVHTKLGIYVFIIKKRWEHIFLLNLLQSVQICIAPKYIFCIGTINLL